MRGFHLVLFFFMGSFFYVNAQVGIGTTTPSTSSVLELSSPDAGFLITRLPLQSLTDATTITNGNEESLIVYNTNTTTDLTPGYYYWSNFQWNKIATLDDISSSGLAATNGLSINSGQIRLGGNLSQPTEIATSSTNTLALSGLETSTSNTDRLLVIDPITNVIKAKSSSSTTTKNQSVVLATAGQSQFTTPSPATDVNKISVYRNGVRVDFTITNTNTIELEPEATCFLNDEVRIVQLL